MAYFKMFLFETYWKSLMMGDYKPYFYTNKDEMIVWTFHTIVAETG